MIKLYRFDDLKPEEILNRDIRAEKNVEDVVDAIIADVRARGDDALKDYALKFDGATIENLQVTQAEIDAKLKINCLKNEAAAAEERLRKGKEELEKFSAAVRAVCDKEIQLLNELPQAPVELPQEEAKPEDSVQEIEDSVMAAFSEAAPEDGDAGHQYVCGAVSFTIAGRMYSNIFT